MVNWAEKNTPVETLEPIVLTSQQMGEFVIALKIANTEGLRAAAADKVMEVFNHHPDNIATKTILDLAVKEAQLGDNSFTNDQADKAKISLQQQLIEFHNTKNKASAVDSSKRDENSHIAL